MLSMLSAERARRLIFDFFNICARRFDLADHRRNVMQGLITHMASRFGEEIVPELVAQRLKDAPATARETKASSAP